MPEAKPRPVLTHVFVYGSLRQGGSNDITRLKPSAVWVGTATLCGVMYDLGDYPGVRLGQGGVVAGEVYAVEPELARQLDAIEEVYPQETGEYVKSEVLVTLYGCRIQCLVYEVNPTHSQGRPVIASGDWFRREAAID